MAKDKDEPTVFTFENYATTDKLKFTLTGDSRVHDTDFVIFVTNAFKSPGEYLFQDNTILVEGLD